MARAKGIAVPKVTGVYRLRNPQVAKVKVKDRTKETFEESNPEPPVGKIQGIQAGSKEEWRVYLALTKLKVRFTYQYAVNGGKRMRGGQVVDFLVHTAPVPTPVYVNGEYWHRTAKQMSDQIKQQNIVSELDGQCFEPLILWARNLQTVDQAFNVLLHELRYK